MTEDGRERSDATVVLLQRWQDGEIEALHGLLERELAWIRARVHARLGPQLARLGDSEDYVQDAMIEVLKYGPRFTISDRSAFRRLMARLIENVIRDHHAYHHAQKRDVRSQKPIPRDSLLDLDPPKKGVTRPSMAGQRNEDAAWIRLAIELLEPDDREVLLLRHWEQCSFAEIAERTGIGENGARMRFNRAMPKLVERMRQLRSGELDEALGD